jgi:hypothetical protein
MDITTFTPTRERLKTLATRRGVVGGLVGATLAAVVGSVPADARPSRKGGGGKRKGKGKGVDKPVGQSPGGSGKGVGPAKPKTRGFNAEALGRVATPATLNCQFIDPQQCTTLFAGTGTADHLGEITFTSSLTADWSQATPQETGGYCAPLMADSSTATFTAAPTGKNDKGELTLELIGTVCGSGAETGYPLVLNGAYTITAGTNRFEGATGIGTVTGSVEGAGEGAAASFTATGKIAY